jgi:hypothetical protein
MGLNANIKSLLDISGSGYGLGGMTRDDKSTLYTNLTTPTGSSATNTNLSAYPTMNTKLTNAVNSYLNRPLGDTGSAVANSGGSTLPNPNDPSNMPSGYTYTPGTKGENVQIGKPGSFDDRQTSRSMDAYNTTATIPPNPVTQPQPQYQGLTLADLDAWWKRQQPAIQNGVTTGGGTANQSLGTLYPRVNWGNYQTSGRGGRYFDPTTGRYQGLSGLYQTQTQQMSL